MHYKQCKSGLSRSAHFVQRLQSAERKFFTQEGILKFGFGRDMPL